MPVDWHKLQTFSLFIVVLPLKKEVSRLPLSNVQITETAITIAIPCCLLMIRWSKTGCKPVETFFVVFSNQNTSKIGLESVICSAEFQVEFCWCLKTESKHHYVIRSTWDFWFFEKNGIASKSGEIWSPNSLWARRYLNFAERSEKDFFSEHFRRRETAFFKGGGEI